MEGLVTQARADVAAFGTDEAPNLGVDHLRQEAVIAVARAAGVVAFMQGNEKLASEFVALYEAVAPYVEQQEQAGAA